MTAIFGYETNFDAIEDFYPDYPKNNFTFNFNTVRVNKEYASGYSLGYSDSFVKENETEIKKDIRNKLTNNYTNNGYTPGNIKKLNKPDTIGNVINMLSDCKYFTSLLRSDPSFIKILNEKNYVHGNTLFLPIDSSFHLLEKFYSENVPDSTKEENRDIYTADLGVNVKSSGLFEILKTHILKQAIYPEQLSERPLRVKPLSQQNEFFVKNMKIFNMAKSNIYNTLTHPYKSTSPNYTNLDSFYDAKEPTSKGNWIDILQAIECSNGFIYIISEPIIPSVFFL
jgi:hypothetical protein